MRNHHWFRASNRHLSLLQVVAIYAGTRGFLDKLPVSDILPFQDALVAHFKSNHAGIMDAIVKQGAIDDSNDKQMKEIIGKFVQDFSA